MRQLRVLTLAACAVLSQFAGPRISWAQHYDVLVQQMNRKLVTGTADFDNNQWQLGLRVFHRDFDSDYAINNPGFNSLAATSPSLPSGAQALPGSADLSWDFLPMTITNDGKVLAQNLFYWNGQDTDGVPGLTPSDVEFGPLPGPNYTLSLFDKVNAKHSVDATDTTVPGGVIVTTNADGSLHQHRYFFLEDGDGDSGTVPADGIYLVALRLRMPGLADSLPVFMVFGTPASSIDAEDDAAVPWVQQQLNLPGDYNRNGVVDAGDYVVWRRTVGEVGVGLAADGDGSGTVDLGDYNLWRSKFGASSRLRIASGGSSVFEAMSVPEPALSAIFLAVAVGCSPVRSRRRSRVVRSAGMATPNSDHGTAIG